MILIVAGVLTTVAIATGASIVAGIISLKIAIPVLAGCVWGWIWAYNLDRRRVAGQERTTARDVEGRLRDLSARANAAAFELRVQGSAQAVSVSLFGIAAALVLIWAIASARVEISVLAASLLCFASYFLLAVVPSIGKPKLTLTRAGFTSPLTPFIAWEDIDGMFLNKIPSRRTNATSYGLMFRVSTLPQNISRYALFHRMGYRLRSAARKDQLGVILKDTTEHPEVIYGLARLLWTERTGRNHDWNPNMSADYNAALRQVSDASRRMSSPQALETLLSGDPHEAKAVLDAIDRGSKTMVKEARRQLRSTNWLLWGSILAMVLLLAMRVLR